jgi:hypothetical protein
MPKTQSRKQTRRTIAARVAAPTPVRRRVLHTAGSQVCLGVLVGWDDQGPLVDFDGNPRGPLHARVAAPGPQARPAKADSGQEVILLLDPRPNHPPVLLGFLQPLDSNPGVATDLEARVDGRRVEIEGRDEIVLRCGEASITLRRNGRVVIRGIQVETRAAGLNRIKGGSVSIN